MINVILNEGLYDKPFVEEWTVGFDELKGHVTDYPPERVGEITWVKRDLIEEAARVCRRDDPGDRAMSPGRCRETP